MSYNAHGTPPFEPCSSFPSHTQATFRLLLGRRPTITPSSPARPPIPSPRSVRQLALAHLREVRPKNRLIEILLLSGGGIAQKESAGSSHVVLSAENLPRRAVSGSVSSKSALTSKTNIDAMRPSHALRPAHVSQNHASFYESLHFHNLSLIAVHTSSYTRTTTISSNSSSCHDFFRWSRVDELREGASFRVDLDE